MAQELIIPIDKSDEEFLIRLKEIQPYLSVLQSNRYETRLCQDWLHKLLNSSQSDIQFRNIYLTELLEQLKNGKLKEPFNRLPKDNEPLLHLTTYIPMQNFNTQEDKETRKYTTRTQINTLISDTLNYSKTVIMFNKNTESDENLNYEIKEIQKDSSNDKIMNFDDDISEESQLQKTISYNSEGGDGLNFKHETKVKLESIEKLYNELKVKNEALTDQVQLYADSAKLSNTQLTVFNDELNKVKNHMDRMQNQDEFKKTDDLQICIEKTTEIDKRIEQVITEISSLKHMIELEDICENKRILSDILVLLEYMKEEHYSQITENQKFFNEQISKYEREIEQLKAYVEIKAEGADGLKKCVNQRLHIDSLIKSRKLVEEYMNDKLSILLPYVTQLEDTNVQLLITNENQRKTILELNEKIDKMKESSKTKSTQDKDIVEDTTKT